RPLDETVPHEAPEQPLPATLQVTAVFVVLVTLAANCCVLVATTCALVGEMVTATGGRMVTLAEADLEESATEVAVTLTCAGFGTEPGAAYKPLDETVPHAAPEQPVPLTAQVTAVFVVFTTVAVNCCVLPATIWAVVGEMLTAMGGRMVIVAEPDFSGFATDVAVTVTTAGFGTEG